LNRRTNTPEGSGGASPTVVAVQHDDDDLMVDTDESTRILGTSSVRAAPTSAAAKSAAPAKETPAKETPAKEASEAPVKEASVNGSSAADEKEADVPALPADTIGPARDSFTFSRPVSAPVSPSDDQWRPAKKGASSSAAEPAEAEPVLPEPALAEAEAEPAEPLVAETGTGWPIDTSLYETGTSAEGGSPAAQPPSAEPATVSAAAFVWDAPAPAPASQSSPARNFLRSNANAKTPAPPRTPAVSVGPGKAQAGRGAASAKRPASSPRPKGSAKRSARQAHLTVARVEPWSVMKFSFVVSLVAFVILFVAVAVIYSTLSALGVFISLQHVVQSVTSSQDSSGVNAAKWFTASRILSYTALLGALNIVLITAMSTIGAVVYNLTSRLIGGVEVTLRETE
jgi:Transmembrane domain of unknown function (DUF3566)